MRFNKHQPFRHSKISETLLLLGAMVSMLATSAWLVGGMTVASAAVLMILLALLLARRLPSHAVMRMHGARRIDFFQAPELDRLVSTLGEKAGLPTPPKLYWVPVANINAIAAGDKMDSAIGISDGALRNLTFNEMAGVLAHEITHLAAGDTRTMILIDIIRRLTGFLTTIGLVLIIVIELTTQNFDFPVWLPVFFFSTPLCLVLLQLALSRSREYAADIGAVRLSGNPSAFVSALRKIDRFEKSREWRFMRRPLGALLPSWMQTHPPITKRIENIVDQFGVFEKAKTKAPRQWRCAAFPRWEAQIPTRHLGVRRCTPRWTYQQ